MKQEAPTSISRSSSPAAYVINTLSASYKSPTTINNKITSLKKLINWGYSQDLIDNVEWLHKLKPLKENKNNKIEDKYLESDELQELLSHIQNKQYKDYYIFLALSGLRASEALALTISDIDLDKRTITINKTISAYNKAVTSPKSATSNRAIYIQDELLEFLKRKLKDNQLLQLALGVRTDLIFFNRNGNIYDYVNLYNYFRKACRKYIGRSLGLHSLRHTHASLMFEQGMSLEAISERLGHSGSAITKQVYLHITDKLKAKYNEEIKNVYIL